MQIEQALFTSAQTARAQGYHLVARSPGIDDRLAQQLALWAPSANALIDRDLDADSLNFFCVDEDWAVLSRTVYAGAEYSDRGEFRLETNILAMRRSQLAGYENHPLALTRAARASGYLRLRPQLSSALPCLSLPAALGTTPSAADSNDETDSRLGEVVSLFEKQRLVIVGCPDPHTFLRQLLGRLSAERRLAMSFSTGLKPSLHRPFRLQFLPEVNADLMRELDARGMKCLTAQTVCSPPC